MVHKYFFYVSKGFFQLSNHQINAKQYQNTFKLEELGWNHHGK